jgi:3-oxoacyl-[acyl-carrier-protein] synthase III
MARIAQIISTARYLPEHLVTNAELTTRFAALGRPHVIDKLANRTGIGKRFFVPDDWVTSDLAQQRHGDFRKVGAIHGKDAAGR